MKIVRLTAENVKRLTAVEITPDGSTVLITGRNGQGKTSVLDAIWFALGGGDATRGTPQPVRQGEDRAEVVLDLGDIVVARTWTAKGGGTLRITNADGLRFPSPQSLLDGLVGKLSFDPLEFARAGQRDQVATLLSVIDLPFDLDEAAAERASLFEARTEVGREVRQAEGQFASYDAPPAPPDLPEAEVPVAEAVAELRAAQTAVSDRRYVEAEVGRLQEQVEQTRRALESHEAALARAVITLEEMPESLDLDALERRVDEVEATNAGVRYEHDRRAVADRLAERRDRYERMTRDLADLDRRKTDAIAAAAMPVPGLGFDDDGVTYNGVPFSQCSSAEQLRVSLGVAMALNPRIRVLRITDGSLLDAENLAVIEEMADLQDFQVWIERVAEDGEVGVVIEDGAVKAVRRRG